jgi:hypothetical protein
MGSSNVTQTTTQTSLPSPALQRFQSDTMPLLTAEATRRPGVYGSTWQPGKPILDDQGRPVLDKDFQPTYEDGSYERTGQPLTAGSNPYIDSYMQSAGGGTGQANWGLGQAGTQYMGAASTANQMTGATNPIFGQARNNLQGAASGQSGLAGQGQFNQASNLYGQGANGYQPYGAAASNLYGQSTYPTGLSSASPYLQAAGNSSAQNVNEYMNPYNQNVTDRIATLGARNLSENLLPQISSNFIKSGGYGGTEQRDLMGRALRDTQESILGQQAGVLQQGYGQGLQAAQGDLARYGQLGATAGSLGTQQQQMLQGAASGLSNVGSTQSGLNMQAGQGLSQIGQANIQASQADYARQLAAGQAQYGLGTAMGDVMAKQSEAQRLSASGLQGLGMDQQKAAITDQNAILGVGQVRQGLDQADIDAERNQLNTENTAVINQIGAAGNAATAGGPGGGTTGKVQTGEGGSTIGQVAGAAGTILGAANAFKAKGGAIKKKKPHSRVSYGNAPRRGIGMFARAS